MYPDDNFRDLRLMYIFGGVYDPERMSTPFKKKLVRCYNYFLLVICLVYCYPCEFVYVVTTTDELYEFLNNVGVLFTITLGVFKWFVMLKFRRNFYEIEDKLNDPYFRYESTEDYDPGKLMLQCKKIARVLIFMMIFAGLFVSFSKYADFLALYARKGHLIGTGNLTCSKILPFYGLMLFNIETPTRCLVGFGLQAVPVSSFVGPIIGFDLTFYIVTLYTRGHLINIRGGFRTLRERCVARLGFPKDYEILRDMENPRLEQEIRFEVRKLSVHLQEIIGLTAHMESICKFVLLGQTFTSLFSLVTCLYIISVEPLFSEMFMVQLQYVSSINIELFSYCFLGSEVTEEGSNVSKGIYDADWLPCTNSIKSTLMINLMRLQKPIFYTIGNFSPLSVNTFVSILKGAYSYYTFLDKT